jgi:hypothetical protein
MTRLLAPLFGALLVACASSSSTTETATTTAVAATATAAGSIEGVYDYVANLPGQQVRGRMRVTGDTVTVEPMADYCRPMVGAPDPLAIRYTCTGSGSIESIQLRIDRRSPVQLSKWTANYRVQRQREVCVRYETRSGRQVCVQTQRETYETQESRSGTLQVRRVQ